MDENSLWAVACVSSALTATAYFAYAFDSTKEDEINAQARLAQIELETAKVNSGYVLQERDVLGGPEPEQFYQIGDYRAFVSIDGKLLDSE